MLFLWRLVELVDVDDDALPVYTVLLLTMLLVLRSHYSNQLCLNTVCCGKKKLKTIDFLDKQNRFYVAWQFKTLMTSVDDTQPSSIVLCNTRQAALVARADYIYINFTVFLDNFFSSSDFFHKCAFLCIKQWFSFNIIGCAQWFRFEFVRNCFQCTTLLLQRREQFVDHRRRQQRVVATRAQYLTNTTL